MRKESLEDGYEHTDANARGIVIFAVVFALSGIAMHLILGGTFFAARRLLHATPVAAHTPPPAPRLQRNPAEDAKEYRAAQESRLHSDGPDHVSIEHAMEQLAR